VYIFLTSSEKSYGRVLFVLSISMFCAMLGIGIIAPVLPLYAKKLGAGGIALGMIMGSFSFSRSGGMVISGELADRMNMKILLIFGLTFYAAASIAYTFASSTGEMILIRIGHGFGSAMVVPITMTIGANIAPPGKEGIFFGSLQGALFLGIGTGPLLSGFLAENVAMEAPFFSMTILTLLSIVLVFIFLPGNLSRNREETVLPPTRLVVKYLLADHEMLVVFFFQFCSAMCRGSLVMMIPILASGMELSLSRIGIIVSLNSLSTGILQRFSGRLADRVHKYWLILAGGLLSAVTLLGLPSMKTPLSLALASIAFGIGHAFASPSLAAIAAERGKSLGAGRVMGFFNIAFSIGMTAGPVLVGFLLEKAGESIPFYFLSLMLFFASFPFFSHRRFEAFESVNPERK